MLTIQTKVTVKQITGQEIINFMLNCTDTDYAAWWPGTHLAFHTIEQYPGNLGNVVYLDEYVGKYRLKFKGLVTEVIPSKKIAWQMIKGVKLPAWLVLEFEDQPGCVRVVHTLKVGFGGLGRIFDPVLRLYFSDPFIAELDKHAKIEFPMLGELLTAPKSPTSPSFLLPQSLPPAPRRRDSHPHRHIRSPVPKRS